ncbi:MAG: hypothetical protein WC375_02570 [Methanomassiliicoccales archaeon]|jgi:hypothetical protein
MNNIELIPFIKQRLDLDEGAEVKLDAYWKDFGFDMIIEDKKRSKTFFIEVKAKVSIESLALLNLYKDHIDLELKSGGHFILVTKSISPRLMEMANRTGIDILMMPREIVLTENPSKSSTGAVKITSEKSWRVVSGLIRLRSSSIRNLSISERVSYGWTHSTINNLITHGIAKKNGNQVSISDMDKLLNGVAWERPTYSLVEKEINIPFQDIHSAAKELTDVLDARGIKFVFSSYFAGMQYTGLGIQFDSIQMYIDADEIMSIKELVGASSDKAGVRLQLMRPDRELFSEAREVGGLKVTSPSQTLLDLAGLGYKGKDLTKGLVAIYDQL